ncbi:Cytochrome c oxidase assembly protein cox11, mitochondrial [Chytridiales sp. JEL 0842]|nr:Cytochrome c oxidase assembly protein cox11, mitochondrial [Chytridiales sp. JEL 0842]
MFRIAAASTSRILGRSAINILFPHRLPTIRNVPRIAPTSNTFLIPRSPFSTRPNLNPSQIARRSANLSGMLYTGSVIIVFIGLSYAAVPLYQLLCSTTGLDGTPQTMAKAYDPSTIKPVPGAKKLKIHFDSSVSDTMKWKFTPQTKEVYVVPGETALAFFTAYNPTDEDIVGISTYSVVPAKAAQYFNKIQCFCFEEQKLAAHEEVDMPVFFYIDPEFAYDPWMKDVSHITLHYTFFRSKAQ